MAERMNTYNVVIRCRDEADLRSFQIGAKDLHDANLLASEAVARLSPETIGAIGMDDGDQGGGVEILDVYEEVYGDPALRLWCRDELMPHGRASNQRGTQWPDAD
jgi:hypothetical protein